MEIITNKYHGAKIYAIRSPHTDKIYIGSTIEKYLSSRLNGHNSKYKLFLKGKYHNVTSFELLKLGDAYIELLESFPCENALELQKREGELIREHQINCVNRIVVGRTKKEYRYDNHDKISEYHKHNIDKAKARKSTPYTCECGSIIQKSAKAPHNRSIKHQNYINSK